MAIKKITLDKIDQLNRSYGGFDKVLDVGCGDQGYKKYIDCNHYIGLEVEVSGRAEDNKKADEYFDGVKIPYLESSFDFILCTEVLEHATSPVLLMSEVKRVLKPGGIALITVPSMWGEHETPFDFRRYTSYGIMQMADELDIEVVDFEKERPGVPALLALARSEIYASHTNLPIKKIANSLMTFTAFILEKVLKVEMPRIYLSNIATLRKAGGVIGESMRGRIDK